MPAKDTNYVLVQATAPLTAANRKDLESAGAKILEYAPDNTYVCRYDPDDLTPVRKLPFVAWAGPYLRGFRVAASLAPPDTGSDRDFAAIGASTEAIREFALGGLTRRLDIIGVPLGTL